MPLTRLARVYEPIGRLPHDLQRRLESMGDSFRAPTGRVLFDESDACRALPLVLEGLIRVVKPLPNGRSVPLYTVGPGELCLLSLSCLLEGQRYPARGVVAEDVEVLALPERLLKSLIDEQSAFRDSVLSGFAMRLFSLVALVEQTAIARVDQRLAHLLVAKGPVVCATHQALADELGTAREVISRILEHFASDGLVRLQRAQIDVVDSARLARAYAASTGDDTSPFLDPSSRGKRSAARRRRSVARR